MNFNYGSFSLFSRIEVAQLHLQAELAQYILEFEIRFSPNNPSHPQYPRNGVLIVDDLKVSASIKDTRQIIGVAEPAVDGGGQTLIAVRPQSAQIDVAVRFHLFLTPAMLAAVENVRNGGDLNLALKLSGKVTGYDSHEKEKEDLSGITWGGENLWNAPPARVYRPQSNACDIMMTVPQSRWVELLTLSGFENTIILEVPVLKSDELGVASSHVREAQVAFSQGRYTDVVARCRDALDALVLAPECPWHQAVNRETRKNMTLEDTFRLSWCAIRQVTHATHHRNNLKSQFTRAMAQYILGTTCLTLSLASNESELFLAPSKDTPPD